jgi:hypothetical protein
MRDPAPGYFFAALRVRFGIFFALRAGGYDFGSVSPERWSSV